MICRGGVIFQHENALPHSSRQNNWTSTL